MRTDAGKLIGFAIDRLATRLRGLDDDEYLWEPVAGDCCWTIGPDDDGRWRADLGPWGTTDVDTPRPPVTTIAWRLWHLGASPDRSWPPAAAGGPELVTAWFSQQSPSGAAACASADEACRRLVDGWKAFVQAVDAFSDEELSAPMGGTAGQYATEPVIGLVLHIADELIHHGAEVALLRDLYAHR